MSIFLEIALPLAKRGFRVFPLVPENKMPLKMSWGDHFDAATTDRAPLEQWSREVPRANVGISPDENFCFLETDDEAALRSACSDVPPEAWDTARVSARENRCYYIFRQTMRTRKAGNMTKTREGQENLFEFKQHRMYVTGPGSIHPKTNAPYGVEWRTIPAMPDVLLNRLCELYGAPKASESHTMSEETKRQTELVDLFLATYEVATTGDWFDKGKQWYRPIECPWKDAHENTNEGTSTCIVYTEGGGYGYDCKHRCAGKGWKDFRAELESRFPDRQFSFVNNPTPVIGNTPVMSLPSQPEGVPAPERKRPDYPIVIWDGTAAGEFGKLCADDNNVPRKFYVEAFLCCLGAVVGDRLTCPVEGALPRSYTIIIAPAGKGKGGSIRRAVKFFSSTWCSTLTSVTPGLLNGAKDFIWKPKGIGAYNASASSGPGMVKLTLDLKKTLETSPQFCWGRTIPRILSVHEELKTLLSTLFIEGGTGTGMDGVICQLWDDTGFAAPGTDKRQAVYGEMQFSLLGAVTEDDWFDLLSRGNVIGGGLMSRLNIIGTEGNYQNVPKMKPPDFTELQQSFLPRVLQLADSACNIPPSEGADRVIAEWVETLPEGSVRMNVHVWRSALLLAWLRREETITEKTAADAVLLGQYQVASQEFYRTVKIDNPYAAVQSKILRALDMKGPATKRELQQRTNASRVGTEIWNRALDGLLKDGRVGKREGGKFYLAVSE